MLPNGYSNLTDFDFAKIMEIPDSDELPPIVPPPQDPFVDW